MNRNRQNKSPVDLNQSRTVVVVQDIMTMLASELPDIKHYEIEPHAPFEDNELPGLAIFLGEEEVLQIAEQGVEPEPLRINSEGFIEPGTGSVCCHHEYELQQFFYVEVLTKQCGGAYATVERLLHVAKQLIGRKGFPDVFYNGSGNFRSEDSLSTTYYSRSLRYYVKHYYNTSQN